jgi:serine protease AprX
LAALLGTAGVAAADAAPFATATGGDAQHALKRFVVKRDGSVADDRFARALGNAGFTVVKSQPSIKLAVVSGPANGLATLRSLAGVASAADDYSVKPQSLGFDYKSQPGSMTNVTAWTGAQAMWKAGYTGAGIDVALLDTGVAPVPALAASDKVVIGADLSFESQAPDARYLDSYGHGTVMGSLIAGRETAKASGATYAADTTNFYGMAPDARLISVKLGDRNGAVDVSQMIAGIDWVVSNRYRVGNIRIINLSYGAKSTLNAQDDPLSWAAEAAWKSGIVVVASTGNDGQSSVGLASPAYNPWIIAVGSNDTKGTATVADDSVASFSNTGNGKSKQPDILAPGVGIVAPNDPNGAIAATYPSAKLGNGFIRGSGTSQSAAIVSGAVALTLSKYNGLSPDALKRFLARTASTIPNVPSVMQGKGMINLAKVLNEAPDWNYTQVGHWADGNGTGSLDAARGGNYVTVNGTQIKGEVDIMGRAWNSATMAAAAKNGNAFDWNGFFNGIAWTGGDFAYDTTSWAGKTWQGKTWQGKTWQTSWWVGKTWQTGKWSSTGWSSATWTGPVAKPGWAGAAWSSVSWG